MANNYTVRDGSSNPLTIKSFDTGSGIQIPQSVPSDATGTAFTDTNPLPTATQARQVTLVERSSGLNSSPTSLTTTSQIIVASNTSRRGFWVQNLDQNNLMYINFGTAASAGPGSIVLPPFEIYVSPPHMVPTAAIYAIGVVNGQLYTAKEC